MKIAHKKMHLQLNQSDKGDWISTSLEDLRKLRISESLQDIKTMSESNFKKLIKTRIKEIEEVLKVWGLYTLV